MRFIKNVGMVSVAHTGSGVFAFLYAMFIARFLGVNDFGLLQAMLGFFSLVTAFSLPLLLATIHGIGRAERLNHPEAVGEYLKVTVYVSAFFAVLIFLAAPWIMQTLRMPSFWPLILSALLILATSVVRIFYGALQGHHQFGAFAILRFLQGFLTFAIGIPILIFGLGVSGALAGYILPLVIISFYAGVKLKLFHWPRGFRHLHRERASLLKIMALFGLLFMIDSIPMVAARINLSPEESGLFGGLFNLRNVVWPFAFAIAFTFYSH